MKRRGYEDTQIKQIVGENKINILSRTAMSELIAEGALDLQKLLVTSKTLGRWKVLSGVK